MIIKKVLRKSNKSINLSHGYSNNKFASYTISTLGYFPTMLFYNVFTMESPIHSLLYPNPSLHESNTLNPLLNILTYHRFNTQPIVFHD